MFIIYFQPGIHSLHIVSQKFLQYQYFLLQKLFALIIGVVKIVKICKLRDWCKGIYFKMNQSLLRVALALPWNGEDTSTGNYRKVMFSKEFTLFQAALASILSVFFWVKTQQHTWPAPPYLVLVWETFPGRGWNRPRHNIMPDLCYLLPTFHVITLAYKDIITSLKKNSTQAIFQHLKHKIYF